MEEKMRNKEKNKILNLFLTFLKIGAFTFGGGYAMIPMIQKEIADNKKWLSSEDILDIVAIAESTPGPIAINAATFVGYKTAKIKGAVAATLGVVLPSFLIITFVAIFFTKFKDNKIVSNAFWGIRIGVLALILKALVNMFKQCKKNAIGYVIMLAAFIAVAFLKVNVLVVIAVSAAIGLIYGEIARRVKKNDLS